MEIAKFSPTKAEIQTAIKEVKNLTIKGVEDVAGYEAVKSGKKKLAEYRIDITKFGKKQREEALAWQREVLRQEKELLGLIEPTELLLKGRLDEIDEEKKRQERLVLLPARKKMLEEIEIKILDAEILRMDEEEFSTYYTEQKMLYLEKQEAKRKATEEEKRRAEELEKAKAEAAEKAKKEAEEKAEREKQEAIIKAEKEKAEAEQKRKDDLARVEKEKQEAIAKLKREQEEKERKIKEAEDERLKKEKEEKEKTEKNKKYQEFLAKNGYTEKTKSEFYIEKNGNTLNLYKKISSLTL